MNAKWLARRAREFEGFLFTPSHCGKGLHSDSLHWGAGTHSLHSAALQCHPEPRGDRGNDGNPAPHNGTFPYSDSTSFSKERWKTVDRGGCLCSPWLSDPKLGTWKPWKPIHEALGRIGECQINEPSGETGSSTQNVSICEQIS